MPILARTSRPYRDVFSLLYHVPGLELHESTDELGEVEKGRMAAYITAVYPVSESKPVKMSRRIGVLVNTTGQGTVFYCKQFELATERELKEELGPKMNGSNYIWKISEIVDEK
jgi:hypothetical protein